MELTLPIAGTGTLQATGGFAMFVLVYRFNPAELAGQSGGSPRGRRATSQRFPQAPRALGRQRRRRPKQRPKEGGSSDGD